MQGLRSERIGKVSAGTFGFTVLRTLLLVVLLLGFAFTLACRLTSMPELQKHAESGLIANLFGKTCGEFGGQFYEQADNVFHKGVGHYHPPAFKDWFVKMKHEVAPVGHVHLHGEGVLEIMPWLYLAARADPYNVNAYTVAAFWLAGEGGRPDLAGQVLNEALRNNPSDYRIYLEKGKLALKEGQYDKATRFFSASLALFRKTTINDKEQMKVDLAETLTYLGLLCEMKGNTQNALHCYREAVKIFPGRLQMKERIMELETKGRAATPPEKLAGMLLFRHRHVCAGEEDE